MAKRKSKTPGIRNYWNIISASQIVDYDRSPRYWYYKSILKLPMVRKGHFGFGTTLAEVLERYLKATPQGEDPDTGEAVDLYPSIYTPTSFGKPQLDREGNPLQMRWDWQLQADSRKDDGDWIKELVREAVEHSFLRRELERWVEKGVPPVMLLEDVRLTGDIDLAYPEELLILDHKSTKNRKYLKSKPKLRTDIQLNIYASFVIAEMKRRGADIGPDTKVTIGHLGYSKNRDDPYGKRVVMKTVEITVAHNEEVMAGIMEMVEEMGTASKVEAEHHRNIECAGSTCAHAYGPNSCPYMCICGGEETVEDYLNRFDLVQDLSIMSKQSGAATPQPTGDTNMESIVERMRRLKAGGTAPKPEATPAPEPTPEPEAPAASVAVNPEVTTAVEIAPEPTPAPAAPAAKGKVSLADLASKAAASQAAQAPAQEAPAETVQPEPEPEIAPETAAPAPEQAQDPETAKRGRGRPVGAKNKTAPKKEQDTSFLLVEGAVVSRTVRKTTIDLIDLLHAVGAQMAEAMGTDNYYKIDTWVRRDAVKAQGESIVADIPTGALVFATSLGDPEMANLFNAIAPFASTVLRKSA